MFSRKYRLPANLSFKKGTTYSSHSFLLKTTQNTIGYNRYGFVVSKKIDTKATGRNEVKRRFRSIVEDLHQKLVQGNDLLFILKPAVKLVETESLKQSISEVLEKAEILERISKL